MEVHDWLGLLFMGVGIGYFYNGLKIRIKAGASKLWPSVQGKIKSSTPDKHGEDDDALNPRMYMAMIQYEYWVAPRHYTNDKLFIGGQLRMGFKKKAEGHCQNYPVGAEATVYYDPNNPQDSVLETREVSSGAWLLGGGVFLVFGVLVYFGVPAYRVLF